MQRIRWSMHSRSVALAVAIVFVFGSAADARRHRTGLGPIAFDRVAPDFALREAIESAPIPTSLAALRGRPVVINFWATYCEPCVDELEAFVKLRETYGADVAFVTVSDQAADIARETLVARGVDSIALVDPDRKIFDLYGVSAIPVTLVLAPDQTVKYVSVGELDWPELRGAVDAVRAPAQSLTPRPARGTLGANAGTPLP